MEQRLWDTVTRLAPLQPEFVSVTYGAGGSTRERTARTVARILKETDVKPAAHLTCVDATREEVDRVVREFAALGVNRFVALRGDPAAGIGENMYRRRAAIRTAPNWFPVCAISRISTFQFPPIRKNIRKARILRPISIC